MMKKNNSLEGVVDYVKSKADKLEVPIPEDISIMSFPLTTLEKSQNEKFMDILAGNDEASDNVQNELDISGESEENQRWAELFSLLLTKD